MSMFAVQNSYEKGKEKTSDSLIFIGKPLDFARWWLYLPTIPRGSAETCPAGD
jgi:hypothetical protein